MRSGVPSMVSSIVITRRAPSESSIAPSRTLPVRIFGPERSCSSATGESLRAAISLAALITVKWSSSEPWEKLSRTTLTPASISASSTFGSREAGPMVATILVRRIEREFDAFFRRRRGGTAYNPWWAVMQLQPGATVAHYKILETLGRGGQATAFKAEDVRLNRPVVIKALRADLAQSEAARRRFEREACLCSALDNAHIQGVYDVGQEGDLYYIVLQYVEGPTLKQFLNGRPLEIKQALRLAIQLADAL